MHSVELSRLDGEVNISEELRDPIEHWAQAWTDRFRLDAEQVDGEVHALCDKIRGLLVAIEGHEA